MVLRWGAGDNAPWGYILRYPAFRQGNDVIAERDMIGNTHLTGQNAVLTDSDAA
jgi:hypothetical protein